jgi:ribosomal protein L19
MKEVPEKLKDSAPKDTHWFGGPIDRSRVALRIIGGDLDPEKISELLSCKPSTSIKKGDTIRSKNKDRTATIGRWSLDSDLSDESNLEEKIWNILKKVSSDQKIWDSITNKYQVDLFCGVFLESENRGFRLSVEIMKELSRFGIEIGFDIYAP